jgi:hypothetical protein
MSGKPTIYNGMDISVIYIHILDMNGPFEGNPSTHVEQCSRNFCGDKSLGQVPWDHSIT